MPNAECGMPNDECRMPTVTVEAVIRVPTFLDAEEVKKPNFAEARTQRFISEFFGRKSQT